MVNRIRKLALACVITAMLGSAFAAERIKLGYLVKQPEEAWFQTEWAYAEKAGKDLGFRSEAMGGYGLALLCGLVWSSFSVGLSRLGLREEPMTAFTVSSGSASGMTKK